MSNNDILITWGILHQLGSNHARLHLTPEGFDCPACEWASELTRIARDGHPDLCCEGVTWLQACRDHGFWGAVQKVKAAYRRRP